MLTLTIMLATPPVLGALWLVGVLTGRIHIHEAERLTEWPEMQSIVIRCRCGASRLAGQKEWS